MSPPFSTRSNAPQRAATRVAARLNAFKRNATRSRSGNRQLDSLSGSYPPERDNWGLELLVKMPVAAKPTTSAQCIQDGSTVVRFSPSTKSATFRSVGCWLWSRVACQLRAWSRFSLTLTWRCVPKSLRHVRSVLLPFNNYEAYVNMCQTTWRSRSSWRWCFPGLTMALAGLSKQLMDRLQSVQNAAAWLISKACRQLLLRRLHWLQMPERISFQLAVLVYRCHLATWPQIFSACHTSTHVDDCALWLHQHWSFHALCVLPLATAPFQRLLHQSGTVCRSRYGHLRHCKFSAADWKPNFLPGLTVMTNNVSLHWILLRDFTV